jgi:hypothetical protein
MLLQPQAERDTATASATAAVDTTVATPSGTPVPSTKTPQEAPT